MKAMDFKLSSLEAKLLDVLEGNKTLKPDIKTRDKINKELDATFFSLVRWCNDINKYNRALSIRIFNISLTEED